MAGMVALLCATGAPGQRRALAGFKGLGAVTIAGWGGGGRWRGVGGMASVDPLGGDMG